MTDFEDAVRVLETANRAEVLALLLGFSDQQRKTFGPKFRHWLTHGSDAHVPRERESLAVVATAGGVRQAMLFATHGWGLTEEFVEDAVHVLARRSPAWLPDFVEAVLNEEGSWNWRVARGLVRHDLVPTPDNPEYYRGTVRGVPDYNVKNRQPLIEQLAKDPGLIGDHLLKMLATEGTGRLLAFHDHYMESTYDHRPEVAPYPQGTWRAALVALTQDGQLDRARLLDAVISAPLRDWAAADLGWYVGMHDALAPALDEVVARQATYARLLTVEHGPSVKLGQRELARILEHDQFNPATLVDASAATLSRSDKASVSTQLRLLDRLRKAHPHTPIADTVRLATQHNRPDIREQASRLLTSLGEVTDSQEVVGAFIVPAVEARVPVGAIDPVTSPDELVEVLLALIEEIDPISMERAIDGLLRFADARPRAADLLLRRASEGDLYSEDPRIAAVVLARAWLTPRRRFRDGDWSIVLGQTVLPTNAALPETVVGALGRRLTGVAHAIRTGGCASVAMPSAADGTIDADSLSRRLASTQRRHEPPELELGIALLRVPPADRSQVGMPSWLSRSRSVSRVIDAPPHNWTRRVVEYRRMKWEPERRIPVFGDPAAREGDGLDGIQPRRQPERTAGEEQVYGDYEPRFEQTLALAALLLPHDPDVLAAHAHPYLHRDLRKDRSVSIPILDALARARTINGDPESSALVLGLAAKDARARTAAQDAVFDLARHGHLDGATFGRQAALHLEDDIVVGQRISSGLAEVARSGEATVMPVLDALEAMMPALAQRKDAGTFVQLAADLAERTRRTIQVPDELLTLAESKSTSMLAKAARRLI